MDINVLFKNFLSEIEQEVSENVYNLWFAPLVPISIVDNVLKIKVLSVAEVVKKENAAEMYEVLQ